jgi:hypothetical protein
VEILEWKYRLRYRRVADSEFVNRNNGFLVILLDRVNVDPYNICTGKRLFAVTRFVLDHLNCKITTPAAGAGWFH